MSVCDVRVLDDPRCNAQRLGGLGQRLQSLLVGYLDSDFGLAGMSEKHVPQTLPRLYIAGCDPLRKTVRRKGCVSGNERMQQPTRTVLQSYPCPSLGRCGRQAPGQ